MIDPNWDLVAGPAAHEIEVLNYSNQINITEALFHLLRHSAAEGFILPPNSLVLRELHRAGTLFLLRSPGEYRGEGEEVSVCDASGTVVYQPPPSREVSQLVEAFTLQMGEMWLSHSPIEIASFCLWRLNWIHPFKNGNGRTARAFAYACLCLKFGFILPGRMTVIDLIMANRDRYQNALRHADNSLDAPGGADLKPMEQYIESLLRQQLSSVPPPVDGG